MLKYWFGIENLAIKDRLDGNFIFEAGFLILSAMFYAAVSINILFLLLFIFNIVSERIQIGINPGSKGVFKIFLMLSGPLIGLAGIYFKNAWVMGLATAGYGLFAFESLMNWIMPAVSFMHIFTFKNLILGRTMNLMKNVTKEQMLPMRKKLTTMYIILWVTSIAAFIIMSVYYTQLFKGNEYY